jgi:hypothetical protein
VPLRECLAEVLANTDEADEVDPAEIERLYESLARSERIVGGYTEFSVDTGGNSSGRRLYSTSCPELAEKPTFEPVRRSGTLNPEPSTLNPKP